MDDQPIQGHMLIADWFGQIQMKRDLGRLHLNCRIWALPVRGGSQPLPGWLIASIVALKIDAKSAPECLFECGEGGAKAIWAMPKCLRDFLNGASLTL